MSGRSGFEVILKAGSPLHIGERKMGIVDLTRRWIPGKNLWGAITAIGAQTLMKQYSPEVYQVIGELLKDAVVFTPFYPYDAARGITYIPFYGQGSLEYICVDGGKDELATITEYEFDLQYIDSYTSTALDYTTYTAAEGMLHELEFVKPGTGFHGYVFCKSGVRLAQMPELQRPDVDLSAADEELAVLLEMWFRQLELHGLGGDRTRGFGNVRCMRWSPTCADTLFTNEAVVRVKDYPVPLQNWRWEWGEQVSANLTNAEKPKGVKNAEKCKAFALFPLLVTEENDQAGMNLNCVAVTDFCGELEPVMGREWSAERGAGQKAGRVEFQIASGSTFDVTKLKVRVDCFGRGY